MDREEIISGECLKCNHTVYVTESEYKESGNIHIHWSCKEENQEDNKNMFRYVLKIGDGTFVRWIQWTGGVVPTILTDSYQSALIVNNEYLDYVIGDTGKTRRDLILEKHPNLQIAEVKVTLA